ncbi:MAG: LexA family transcriptional repressor [Ruminococcaceae bacterium]|nr:LexA family transcriptional repressor [Oscillospiraceae bacterium]
MRLTTMELLNTIDDMPVDFFVDNLGIIPLPETRQIPLLGLIACGAPILAEEHIEEYVDMPKYINADFALTCKGDSMINARIFDGDIVYIRQQDTVDSGEIAAVLIDGEATLKRVQLFEDHISLEPENPQYRPMVYWGEEMNNIRILGKAVAFTSTLR